MISTQIVVLFISALLSATPADSDDSSALLIDGAILSRVVGKAVYNEAADAWRFSASQTLHSKTAQLPAGRELRLLPCRGLELIKAYAGSEKSTDIRLTGMVTNYDGINFLYTMDALPVREMAPTPKDDKTPPAPPARLITDPNETSVMPQEIFQQLQAERKTDFSKIAEVPNLAEDRMLVNRTGFFAMEKGNLVFRIDGFGLGAPARTFRLLPNAHRFHVEERMKSTFGKTRYTVSAIETVSQDQAYLLIQRARPARSYGNFTP